MVNMNTQTALKPTRPTPAEWLDLQSRYRKVANTPCIDVLIPVYGAPDDTLRCLYSVLSTKNDAVFNLIIIEDCGPDPQLRVKLYELSKIFHFEYLENSENKGFVLTCNRGFNLHPQRDILLLNSDTEVFDGWIDRILSCAKNNPKAGTITAMSNNATICSYPYFCEDYSHSFEIPDSNLDKLFSELNQGESITAPTGVGFCMYIRRNCLNEIGGFNYELFGKGYGEENDLCVRAENAGWQNLIALDVFVRHYGSSSFSNAVRSERVENAIQVINRVHPNYIPSVTKFVSNKPTTKYLLNIDMERLKNFITNKQVFLNITHNRGGGTEKHHLEMCEKLSNEGFAVVSIKSNANNSPVLYLDGKYPLPNIKIPESNSDKFSIWIKETLSPVYVHIHHLIDFPHDFGLNLTKILSASHIPYYYTAHDYHTICPKITLMDDDLYCGEPTASVCNRCIANMVAAKPFDNNIIQWRDHHQEILLGANKVFVPDEDVMWRLQRYFPNAPFVVHPHFDYRDTSTLNFQQNPNSNQVRIGILGAIGIHKGMNQLYSVARECLDKKKEIQFIIIGCTSNDNAFEELSNVEILGQYNDDDLISKIYDAKLSAIWFPAVCPETYSYTLSAALATGLPIFAYDFGAVARRLKSHCVNSTLIPLNTMLNPKENIAYLTNKQALKLTVPKSTSHTYPSISHDYYGLTNKETP